MMLRILDVLLLRVDYPDFGHPLANAVTAGEYELGNSICGTGNGINMVVNKHPGNKGCFMLE